MTDFVFATALLMETFFARGYPLRGAISHGDIVVKSEPHIFLSDTFKRLSTLGNAQEWTGCVVLPEAESVVIENLLGLPPSEFSRSSALHKFDPPWKPTIDERNIPLYKDLLCINWSYFVPPSKLSVGLEFLRGDAKKFDMTQAYLDQIGKFPDDKQMLGSEFYPAKTVRTMKARGSIRMSFWDELDEPTKPGCGFRLEVHDT
nr:hypothetical protein DBT53_12820 [Aerococcus mictus]